MTTGLELLFFLLVGGWGRGRGFLQRVLAEGEGDSRGWGWFPLLPSCPTTPQPLSWHPSKNLKIQKNRIAFSHVGFKIFCPNNLPSIYYKFNSPPLYQLPSPNSTSFTTIWMASSFNLQIYSTPPSSSPLLNRTLISFRWQPSNEAPLLYLTSSLLATLFFRTSSIHYPLPIRLHQVFHLVYVRFFFHRLI